MADDRTPPEEPEETPAAEEQPPAPVDARAGDDTTTPADAPVEAPLDEERPQGDPLADAATDEPPAPATEAPAGDAPAAEAPARAPQAPAPPAAPPAPAAEAPAGDAPAAEAPLEEDEYEEDVDETPRVKPEIPGADLEVDIVEEGADPLALGEGEEDEEATPGESLEDTADQPIVAVAIDLAAGARYRATGKRKTAIARVILLPGTGQYTINGRPLDVFFPRPTLQRTIRQPLEAVGYEDRMDVVARMHGGGVSAQADALRHGISRALLEADPNLRGELKRRGFLTRDPRVKERKKAGLKKARKRPQFSKR
jgi:small subunit ribosomal protein S9